MSEENEGGLGREIPSLQLSLLDSLAFSLANVFVRRARRQNYSLYRGGSGVALNKPFLRIFSPNNQSYGSKIKCDIPRGLVILGRSGGLSSF